MNLPNKLTIFRIILVPIFITIGYIGVPGTFLGVPATMWVMNLIFIIASITDKLDGTIARKNNLVTNFGKFLDPIADKILVCAALIMLVEFNKVPAWIPIIVIFREFLVSGFRLIAVEQGGQVIAASKWGKLKTVTQMIAIILVLMDKFAFFEFIDVMTLGTLVNGGTMNALQFIINFLSSVLMFISVIACIFSGWDYLKGGKQYLQDK